MDGENNGKPYFKWMIWGENHPFFGNTHLSGQGIAISFGSIYIPGNEELETTHHATWTVAEGPMREKWLAFYGLIDTFSAYINPTFFA